MARISRLYRHDPAAVVERRWAEFHDDPPDNALMKRIGAVSLPAQTIDQPNGR